jgi:predicted nucleic acid-binding protein
LIVADTSAIVALLDADDAHHADLRRLFGDTAPEWVLPWAVLPEVDYLAGRWIGEKTAAAFRRDLAAGRFAVEWGRETDLIRAEALCRKHRTLRLGLVDAVVLAIAERTRAAAIATLDLRHFAAVRLAHAPRLLPRDA